MKMGFNSGQMKQANDMLREMTKIQEGLATETVEGNAGGGMVRAVFKGNGDFVSIHLEKEVVNPDDVEMLEDLISAAIGDGIRKAKDLNMTRMGPLAGLLGGMI